ncbi:MAG: penicillin-binding transpeptidase domain-containing protein, partial [Chloroflexi bacterium]|nr:penicillin-binding transpeptidase domain-containing protein [Chloroflexota bacterium]
PASEFQVRAAAAYPFGPLAEFLGFGSPEVGMKAGIGGLLNAVGLTPPAHAAKIAEGQATAFQFAVVTAALATDGKLLAPLLVQNISDANGDVDRRYEPKDLGALPLTADQLVDVRKRLAEMPQEPETLLATTLAGFPRAVAAADAQTDETGGPAWFAGYAPAEAPRYVVVAVAEASDDANAKVMKAARGTLDRLGL